MKNMVHYVHRNQSVLVILTVLFVIWNFAQGKRLPTLWQDDRSEIKFYHLLSELEVHDSGKSFILEEWASISRQTFRLDSIESPDGVRNTILADRATNELFQYKPFTCSLVQNFSNSLNAHLADKFPNLETFIPTGIGALWLHSILLEAEYNNESIKTSSPLASQSYSKYTVPSTDKFPYRVEFYFAGGGSQSGALQGENLKTLAAVKLLHPTEDKVVMRARILEQETTLSLNSDGSDDVFDLPSGYGCERASGKLEGATPQPIYQFDPAKQQQPLVMQLDMVTLQPISLAHDHEKWRAHSTSIRLASGQLAAGGLDVQSEGAKSSSRGYLVLETQDYAAESNSPKYAGSQVRKATLRRIKRIWDLGEEMKSNEDEVRKLYYEIDEQTGRCLGYGEGEPLNKDNKEARLDFDVVSREQSVNSYLLNPIQDSPLVGLTLNMEIIRELFSASEGYHLIRSSDSRSKESIYERRISTFQVFDRQGKLRWSGPVSVVRRSWLQETPPLRRRKSFTTVTIHFLSKKLDRVEGKLQLEVVERRYVDYAYFHRQLDVSECFVQVSNGIGDLEMRKNSRNSYHHSSGSGLDEQVEFFVTYPVETQVAKSLSESDHFEALIYEKFLDSMLSSSKGQLDLLQVVDLRVLFSPDTVQVSGRLIGKPSVLSYLKLAGQKFSNSRRNLLLTEFKSHEEACAQSCDLYRCAMFVYCPSGRICDLMLGRDKQSGHNGATQPPMTFEPEPTCSLYRPRSDDSFRRLPLRPGELVNRLRRAVNGESDSTSDEQPTREEPNKPLEPLVLDLEYRTEDSKMSKLRLVPDSFDSGQVPSREISKLIIGAEKTRNAPLVSSPSSSSNATRYQGTQLASVRGNLLRAEYALTFNDRKYLTTAAEEHSELFPVAEAKHLSYEQCEELCGEIDCQSFSYCALDTTCYVSRLQKSSEMLPHLEEREFCVVMARDYLSKFQRQTSGGQVQVDGLLPAVRISARKVESSRDCAISCIEEPNFKCRSFYYCYGETRAAGKLGYGSASGSDCYLGRSYSSTSSSSLSSLDELVNVGANTISSGRTTFSSDIGVKLAEGSCEFYSRSYLADFDRYSARRLPVGSDRFSLVSFKGLGAEGCAAECAAQKHRFCPAFQVCRPSSGSGEAAPNCVVQSIAGEAPLEPLLESDENCTTFLLARPATSEQVDTCDNDGLEIGCHSGGSSSSNWLVSKVALLLFGLILGYFITELTVKRRRANSTTRSK